MCGIAGYLDSSAAPVRDPAIAERMLRAIRHRGPDSSGHFSGEQATLAFCRLALVDLETGDQPIYNEDRSVVLLCNGEIYNHRELREGLLARQHRFTTRSDVEVIVHLYEEYGASLVEHLSGQFAFALYDRRQEQLLLARDHSGIAPMYFARRGHVLVFASEIKALLQHPRVSREVDLIGLDQVMSFPGLVSPRTMFAGVEALTPGSLLVAKNGAIEVKKYWDLDYPLTEDVRPPGAADCESGLLSALRRSVERRLQADVPVGVYLSGGLDSSLIACLAAQSSASRISTFSIAFDQPDISEEKHQRLVAKAIGSEHHELRFGWADCAATLQKMIFHAECPVKETYNACSLALSAFTRECGIKAILTGEGADELFAGYPGYKFDALRARSMSGERTPAAEQALRMQLWGDATVGYEKTYSEFARLRTSLYSSSVKSVLQRSDALSSRLAEPALLLGRHPVHQRSVLDFRLRLSDHLLTEHGDRMLLANSVEGRYPFLDQEFVNVARLVPPELKLAGFDEKHILKRIARSIVPKPIVNREKYGFHAPGSPWLLKHGGAWMKGLLSPERINEQGYFDWPSVERLIARYSQPGFTLDPRMEDDQLMIVISFGLFLDSFELPSAA